MSDTILSTWQTTTVDWSFKKEIIIRGPNLMQFVYSGHFQMVYIDGRVLLEMQLTKVIYG